MMWCLHKDVELVEISTFSDPAKLFLHSCGGLQMERLDVCPQCGDGIPEEDDLTGEGPVYWKVTDEPFCSMECVVLRHRRWLMKHGLKPLHGEELWKTGNSV